MVGPPTVYIIQEINAKIQIICAAQRVPKRPPSGWQRSSLPCATSCRMHAGAPQNGAQRPGIRRWPSNSAALGVSTETRGHSAHHGGHMFRPYARNSPGNSVKTEARDVLTLQALDRIAFPAESMPVKSRFRQVQAQSRRATARIRR